MADEESKNDKTDIQVDEDQKLAILSKVVKSGSVETFDWQFTDRVPKKSSNTGGRKSDDLVTTKLTNL